MILCSGDQTHNLPSVKDLVISSVILSPLDQPEACPQVVEISKFIVKGYIEQNFFFSVCVRNSVLNQKQDVEILPGFPCFYFLHAEIVK